MKINEIIRQRRLHMGLTQEQLALRLGVTAPAVNKWEKGLSYPDITLLPPLARLLGTDLNTLLSFKDELTPREITEFINTLADTIQKQGFLPAYEMAMEKIREYPHCYELILSAATVLDGAGILDPNGSQARQPYAGEIENLYFRALESRDYNIKNRARSMLITKFMERKDYDRAQEMIHSLPDDTPVDKKQLQANLYIALGQLDDAAKIQEGQLITAVNHVQTILLTLMEIALKENRTEDARYLADISQRSARLFDLWEYNAYTAHLQLYTTLKDQTQCLAALSSILKAADRPWDPNKSPLYRHVKTKSVDPSFGETLKKTLIHAIISDPETDFLKDSPDFKALANRRE